MRLVGNQVDPEVPGELVAGPQLLSRPFTDTDVESLPLAYDARERLHGFFQRRFEIVAVRLVEVDVVGLESGQGTVDGLKDVFTGESDIVVSPWGPVGPKTLVKISRDWRRSPVSASPRTVSAMVLA